MSCKENLKENKKFITYMSRISSTLFFVGFFTQNTGTNIIQHYLLSAMTRNELPRVMISSYNLGFRDIVPYKRADMADDDVNQITSVSRHNNIQTYIQN
jgi:hypothetical protein